MKTVRIALVACMAALFTMSLVARADQAKAGSKAAAPVVKEMKAAQPVTIIGTVKCEKDAKGVLKSVGISEHGILLKVVAKDEQKVAAFDGQKVDVTGVVKGDSISIEKIAAVKAVEKTEATK